MSSDESSDLSRRDDEERPDGAGPASPQPDPLLAAARRFAERLRSAGFFRGSRRDAELGRDGSGGGESWAEEMVALFARAGDAFLDGRRETAGRALGTLPEAFLPPHRHSIFAGDPRPETALRADLDLAKARYLRCVYEAAVPAQRARVLLREIERFHRVGSRGLGLSAVIGADPAPLEGFDTFLPCWIERLSSLPPEPDRPGWEEVRRKLIREALVLSGGIDALRDLARSRTSAHPEAYGDWVRALARRGEIAAAIAAAREGLDAVEDRWHRAHLADRLAALREREGRRDLAFEARREAWRAYPTLSRLLAICRDARERGILDRIIEEEADSLRIEAKHPWARAAARLWVLAGNAGGIAALLEEAPGRGWSRSNHPAPVGLPFLLAFGCGAVPPPAGSFLARLWEGMGGTRREGAAERAQPLWAFDESDAEPAAPLGEPSEFLRLVIDLAARRAFSPEERRAMLDAATRIIEKRVESIVRPRYRERYPSTIAAVLACAEARVLSGERKRGEAFIASILARYRRHATFSNEIETARRRSPLLAGRRP